MIVLSLYIDPEMDDVGAVNVGYDVFLLSL